MISQVLMLSVLVMPFNHTDFQHESVWPGTTAVSDCSPPVTMLFPLGSHCRAKGPEPDDAWQPIDTIATALSSSDMGAGVGGSSSGMHSRQHMACDSGTRPPPLSCGCT